MKRIVRGVCRAILCTPAALLIGSAALAAPPAKGGANDFLKFIYVRYYPGPDCSKNSLFDSNETIRRYFEPKLAAGIIGAEGIDVDPFVDAQDCYLKSRSIRVDRADADKASATVQIWNFGPKRLRFEVVHLPAGWRIFDIVSTRSGSFRAQYVKQ